MMFSVIPLAAKEDATALAMLEAVCFSSGWSAQEYVEALGNIHHKFYGIRFNGDLVAYMALSQIGECMEVLNLGVHPDFRRKGLAARLVRHVQKTVCPAHGIERIVLDVRVSNRAARALYHRFNFVETGRRRGYYQSCEEDALVLEWRAPATGIGQVEAVKEGVHG